MLGGGTGCVPVAHARRVAGRHDEAPQAIGPAADCQQAAVVDDLRLCCRGEGETQAGDDRAEEAGPWRYSWRYVWRYLNTGGAASSVGGAWISILILVGSTVEGASRK